ncbi:MAG: hypothetical protein PHS92_03680 [Candidatus Gracilibacteria bacterium]|nr:hypothetical protein [Candidatus Gracilibacteria bacterium]
MKDIINGAASVDEKQETSINTSSADMKGVQDKAEKLMQIPSENAVYFERGVEYVAGIIDGIKLNLAEGVAKKTKDSLKSGIYRCKQNIYKKSEKWQKEISDETHMFLEGVNDAISFIYGFGNIGDRISLDGQKITKRELIRYIEQKASIASEIIASQIKSNMELKNRQKKYHDHIMSLPLHPILDDCSINFIGPR